MVKLSVHWIFLKLQVHIKSPDGIVHRVLKGDSDGAITVVITVEFIITVSNHVKEEKLM